MSLVKHEFIQNRADFIALVDQAIADTQRLRGNQPWAPMDSILRQLEGIQQWVSNGRSPSKQERQSITIGRILTRELEPAATDELDIYIKKMSELTFYFKLWWPDDEWARMDSTDRRLSFPDDQP